MVTNERPESESREGRCGRHLTLSERGVIEAGLRAGRSFRAIARELGCSPGTVANEVRRGTPACPSEPGRPPEYEGLRGQQVYEEHRRHCHRPARRRVRREAK